MTRHHHSRLHQSGEPTNRRPPTILVWSRSDIMLAGAPAIGSRPQGPDPAGVSGRVFYWPEDDEDLAYVGQMVEVKGDLEDFEKGQIEMKRDNGSLRSRWTSVARKKKSASRCHASARRTRRVASSSFSSHRKPRQRAPRPAARPAQ
jgi:hypothetical protein